MTPRSRETAVAGEQLPPRSQDARARLLGITASGAERFHRQLLAAAQLISPPPPSTGIELFKNYAPSISIPAYVYFKLPLRMQ